MTEMTTIGKYLIQRLEETGLTHAFGVPGDYVLDFMDRVVDSSIKLVGTCNELNAGYAADGYARVKSGLGAAIVTYNVGALSLANAVAGAEAERLSLLVISGAPPSFMRHQHKKMHHLANGYDMQIDIFRRMTVDSANLLSSQRAPEDIDRVIKACLQYRRPAYIELPMDMVDQPCCLPQPGGLDYTQVSDPEALNECIAEIITILKKAQRPAILLGLDVHRFGLQKKVLSLIEALGCPFCVDINGKGLISEDHPQFAGLYMGQLSQPQAGEIIDSSDGVLSLGAWKTDIATASFSTHIDEKTHIHALSHRVKISNHYYDQIYLGHFLEQLTAKIIEEKIPIKPVELKSSQPPHLPAPEDKPMTTKYLKARMNEFLTKEMIVIGATGDSMFMTAEMHMPQDFGFVCQAYYASIGYSLAATLGISLAYPQRRPLLFIGDGAFQMTAQCVSTLIRYKTRPIIILLNNDGYLIERMIHDGPYNDLQSWQYYKLPEVFGHQKGWLVKTETQLEDALEYAQEHQDELVFIEVCLHRHDCSETMSKVAQRIRQATVK